MLEYTLFTSHKGQLKKLGSLKVPANSPELYRFVANLIKNAGVPLTALHDTRSISLIDAKNNLHYYLVKRANVQ